MHSRMLCVEHLRRKLQDMEKKYETCDNLEPLITSRNLLSEVRYADDK